MCNLVPFRVRRSGASVGEGKVSWFFLLCLWCLLVGLGSSSAVYAAAPTTTSVSPDNAASLVSVAKTITAVYSDTDGATDIQKAQLLVGATTTQSNSLCAVYDRATNKLFLYGDDGTTLSTGYAPGSANTLTNTQGSLNCAATTVSSVGNNVTIAWNFTPSTSYTGAKNVYQKVIDSTPNTVGWNDKGDWVISSSNVAPVNVSLAPTNTSGLVNVAKTFTAVYSDANGVGDINQGRLLIQEPSGTKLYGIYFPPSNKLYMYADDGTTLVGGYTPGSANTITNSQGSLNCAATTVSMSGNTLTVNWNFTPSSTYTGSKLVRLQVVDNASVQVGWADLGQWVISSSNVAPTNTSVSPNNASSLTGAAKTITAVYSDANGVADLIQGRIMVRTNTTANSNALCATYYPATDKLYLYADDGTTAQGGYAPGSANTITNSQGTLNCAATTVSMSGNTLTVNWNFTPATSYTGSENVYLQSVDAASTVVGWNDLGDWVISASNSTPTNVSVSPVNVSSLASVAKTITGVYSDVNGVGDIAQGRLLVRSTNSSHATSLSALYYTATNLLYMYNDAGTALLGGYAPSSANTITNSQGTLNCAATTVSLSGNNLTVNWNFTPTSAFAGSQNLYLNVVDVANTSTGYVDYGDWVISTSNVSPTNVSASPNNASSLINVAKTITAVYSDANGVGDLIQGRIMVRTSTSANSNALCATYYPVTNKLYLYADDGTTAQGGYAPGSANTITNSQGSLNCAATTVTMSGNTLTINWNFTPNSTYTGSENVYLQSVDAASTVVGWTDLGDWVISSSNVAPTNVSASPSNASSLINVAKTITTVSSDANGSGDFNNIYIMVDTAVGGANSLYARYDAVNNKLYLRNDAHTADLGGYAPGSANTITNSQGSLNCAATTVTRSGNNITIGWNLTPSSSYTGTKNIYLYSSDVSGVYDWYEDMGDWVISASNVAPTNGTVTPSPVTVNAGTAQTFTTTYVDTNGVGDVNEAWFLLQTSVNGANAIYCYYNSTTNLLSMRDNGNTAWSTAYAPGSSNVISNSQGSLNCAATTVSRSGNTLTINWNVTPATAFVGTKNIYLSCKDVGLAQAAFEDKGDCTINAAPVNGTVTPNPGTSYIGEPLNVTITYSDTNGGTDIVDARVIINSAMSGANSLSGRYDRATNKIYLYSDSGTVLLGGFAPGSANTITNSQGTLNCAATTVSTVGNTLTINWSFTPNGSFQGSKNIYPYSKDAGGLIDNFELLGTWTVGRMAPGLVGSYFTTNDLSGAVAARAIEPDINFDWSTRAPYSTVPADYWSARFEGYIVAPFTGDVEFRASADDLARLWINGQKIFSNWSGEAAPLLFGHISLVAGQRYPIVCEYFEYNGPAKLQLKWGHVGDPGTIIPDTAFFHEAGVMGAPTNLTATAGNQSVTLTWSAVYQAAKYAVYRSSSATGPWTLVSQVNSPTVTLTDTPLDNGTQYFYTVSTLWVRTQRPDYHNIDPDTYQPTPGPLTYDESTLAPAVSAVPGASLVPPSHLEAEGQMGRVILKWDAAPGATSYQLARQDNGTGSWNIITTTSGLTYTNLGTANGVVFRYVVRAVQGATVSADSNVATVLLQDPPLAPVGVTATPGNAEVTLNWTASSGATSYLIKRATQTGGPYVLVDRTSSTSYVDSGVVNGQIYYYVICATMIPVSAPTGSAEVVSMPSNEVGVTPQFVPLIPLFLKATAGDTKIKLEWGASEGAQSYQIWRSSNGGTWTQVGTTPVNTEFFINTGLTNGVIQSYLVRAINGSGASQDSNHVTLAAQAVPPLKPDVPSIGVRTTTSIEVITPTLPFNATSFKLMMGSGYSYDDYDTPDRYVTIATGLGGSASTIVSDLTPNSEYRFYVIAVGTAGETASYDVSAQTYILAPDTPQAPIYRNVTNTAVTAYTDSITRGTATLKLQRQTAPSVWADINNGYGVVTASPSSPYTEVTGLTANTSYTFRWVAISAAGLAGVPAQQVGPSSTVTTAPAVPETPVVEVPTSSTLRVQRVATGTTVPALPAGATSLTLQQLVYSDYYSSTYTWANLATGLTGNAVVNLTGLWPDTSYQFRYVAVGAAGSTAGSAGYGSTSSGTAPSTPFAPQFTNVKGTQVTVVRPYSYTYSSGTDWVLQQYNGTTYNDIHTFGAYDTSYDVTSLSTNTLYTFRFRIGSNNGTTASVTTAPAVPAAPTVGTVTSSSVALTLPTVASGITLTLQRADANTDGYYEDYYDYGVSRWTTVSTGNASGASVTVSGLMSGIHQIFRVIAVGPDASTNGTATSEVVVLDPAPTAPPAPRCAAVGPDTVIVPIGSNWPLAIHTYVQYKTVAGSTWTDTAEVSHFPATMKITGLTAATDYQVRLKIVGNNGTAYSAATTVTTFPAAPPVPSEVTSAKTSTSLTFNVPSSLPAGATSLTMERSRYNGYTSVWSPVLTNVTTASSTVTLSGLSASSESYDLRWVAVGAAGRTPGPDAYFYVDTSGPAAAPGAPQFSDLDESSVNVWPSTPTVDQYTSIKLLYKRSTDSTYTDLGYQAVAYPDSYTYPYGVYTPFQVGNLEAGATYNFKYIVPGTPNVDGTVANLTIPSPVAGAWAVGTGISCDGIRYPFANMTIHSGDLGHFNSYHANDWDVMLRSVNGLNFNKNVSDTCSYAWTAKSGGVSIGSFPDGANGPNVGWLAPTVSVPTTVTLTLTVNDQAGANQGALDTGTRADNNLGGDDAPLHFSINIKVVP